MKQGSFQTASNRPPKLLDQLRSCIREKHYSLRTERAYVYWARWYIRFHGLRHPKDMGGPELRLFMSYLVNERRVAGAILTQALCVLLILHRTVLEMELPWIEGIHRPKKPPKQPVVLTPDEVHRIFSHMEGSFRLFAQLLYGTGMRLSECAQLRIKDVDFQRREIVVRAGKGGKDRVTMLPLSLIQPMRAQIASARTLWQEDRIALRPGVMLPYALESKYPKAGEQLGWFWVFPSDHESVDPRSAILRRHHLYPQTVQRAIKRAVVAGQNLETGDDPFVSPFVRYSVAGIGLRHPDGAGAAWPRRRLDHNDLYACAALGRAGRHVAHGPVASILNGRF